MKLINGNHESDQGGAVNKLKRKAKKLARRFPGPRVEPEGQPASLGAKLRNRHFKRGLQPVVHGQGPQPFVLPESKRMTSEDKNYAVETGADHRWDGDRYTAEERQAFNDAGVFDYRRGDARQGKKADPAYNFPRLYWRENIEGQNRALFYLESSGYMRDWLALPEYLRGAKANDLTVSDIEVLAGLADQGNQAAWLACEAAIALRQGRAMTFYQHHPIYPSGKRNNPGHKHAGDVNEYLSDVEKQALQLIHRDRMLKDGKTPEQIDSAIAHMGYSEYLSLAYSDQGFLDQPLTLVHAHGHNASLVQSGNVQQIGVGHGGGELQPWYYPVGVQYLKERDKAYKDADKKNMTPEEKIALKRRIGAQLEEALLNAARETRFFAANFGYAGLKYDADGGLAVQWKFLKAKITDVNRPWFILKPFLHYFFPKNQETLVLRFAQQEKKGEQARLEPQYEEQLARAVDHSTYHIRQAIIKAVDRYAIAHQGHQGYDRSGHGMDGMKRALLLKNNFMRYDLSAEDMQVILQHIFNGCIASKNDPFAVFDRVQYGSLYNYVNRELYQLGCGRVGAQPGQLKRLSIECLIAAEYDGGNHTKVKPVDYEEYAHVETPSRMAWLSVKCHKLLEAINARLAITFLASIIPFADRSLVNSGYSSGYTVLVLGALLTFLVTLPVWVLTLPMTFVSMGLDVVQALLETVALACRAWLGRAVTHWDRMQLQPSDVFPALATCVAIGSSAVLGAWFSLAYYTWHQTLSMFKAAEAWQSAAAHLANNSHVEFFRHHSVALGRLAYMASVVLSVALFATVMMYTLPLVASLGFVTASTAYLAAHAPAIVSAANWVAHGFTAIGQFLSANLSAVAWVKGLFGAGTIAAPQAASNVFVTSVAGSFFTYRALNAVVKHERARASSAGAQQPRTKNGYTAVGHQRIGGGAEYAELPKLIDFDASFEDSPSVGDRTQAIMRSSETTLFGGSFPELSGGRSQFFTAQRGEPGPMFAVQLDSPDACPPPSPKGP